MYGGSGTAGSKDPFYFTYSGYSTRSNNFSNAGPHQVHIKNSMYERSVQVVGWTLKKGRLEEDFTKNVIKPALFNTARLVPVSWTKGDPVIGAVVFRIEGTDNYFTLALEDPYLGDGKEGYKAYLMEGNNPEAAIASLAEDREVQVKNVRCYSECLGSRPKTVIQFVET